MTDKPEESVQEPSPGQRRDRKRYPIPKGMSHGQFWARWGKNRARWRSEGMSAAAILDARQTLNLTQDQAADFIGCSRHSYKNYESGQWIPNANLIPRFKELQERALAITTGMDRGTVTALIERNRNLIKPVTEEIKSTIAGMSFEKALDIIRRLDPKKLEELKAGEAARAAKALMEIADIAEGKSQGTNLYLTLLKECGAVMINQGTAEKGEVLDAKELGLVEEPKRLSE